MGTGWSKRMSVASILPPSSFNVSFPSILRRIWLLLLLQFRAAKCQGGLATGPRGGKAAQASRRLIRADEQRVYDWLSKQVDISTPSWTRRCCSASQLAWRISSIVIKTDTSLGCFSVRPVESHSGARPGNLAEPQTFSWASLGRKFLIFFQNGTRWRTLYFWPTAGPPNVAEPGVANHPYPTLSTGLFSVLAQEHQLL